MNVAAQVRADKEANPENYCPKCGARREGGSIVTSTLEQRFWARVRKTDGCWLWIGATRMSGTPWDYGRLKENGKLVSAHRVSYRLHFGPIPQGENVLHHCDNTLCVRPDHLFLGTQADNVRDMIAKGRRAAPRKTVRCKHGHDWTPENIRLVRTRGIYVCVICERARRRKAYHNVRQRHPLPQPTTKDAP